MINTILASVYWSKELKVTLLIIVAVLFVLTVSLLIYELFFKRESHIIFKVNEASEYDANALNKESISEPIIDSSMELRQVIKNIDEPAIEQITTNEEDEVVILNQQEDDRMIIFTLAKSKQLLSKKEDDHKIVFSLKKQGTPILTFNENNESIVFSLKKHNEDVKQEKPNFLKALVEATSKLANQVEQEEEILTSKENDSMITFSLKKEKKLLSINETKDKITFSLNKKDDSLSEPLIKLEKAKS